MSVISSAKPHTVPLSVPKAKAGRLLYVDNIRVFLTVLVILHHLMIIYSGNGSWIYNENLQDAVTSTVGRWFCSVNQSFFMGLFLFISAYFVPASYDRKGPGRFLVDRLIRLGIPLVIYGWMIRPLWIYNTWSFSNPFWTWYRGEYFRVYGYIGGGPLWFIEVLLIFACFYALYRAFKPQPVEEIPAARFPRDRAIVLFAFLLGIVSFVVRIWFPQNSSIAELNLQLANFPQYIALFVLGLMAYPRNWLVTLPERTAHRWMLVVVVLSALPLLVGFERNPQAGRGPELMFSLISAWWEAFMCVGMCIAVVSLFRRYANQQGQFAGWSSRNAYTAYLIHEPVITSMAMAIAGLALYPLIKFALMGLVSVPLIFLSSALILKIPYTDRVL
jgi:hypothetical protein